MEGVIRLKYDQGSDRMRSHRARMHANSKRFYHENAPTAATRFCDSVIEYVESKEGDASLVYCLWHDLIAEKIFDFHSQHGGLIVVLFPAPQTSAQYHFVPETRTVSLNQGLRAVHSIEPIYIDGNQVIHTSARIGKTQYETIENRIIAGLFLTLNPSEFPQKYPWFP